MVVVVTGSSRGIGRAVALDCARSGDAVVVNGRDGDAVAAVVDEIIEAGGVARGVSGSAADPATVELLVDAAADVGEVRALITCAGTAEPEGSSILDITPDQWHELIDAHLTATFLACRAFAPALVARGGGAIVTTASHAFTGMYGGTGYAAGKGGVVSLTYALAAELRQHGIRVNAICPGARTRLSEGESYESQIGNLHARGLIDDVVRDASLSPAPPEYVTPLYRYLAGDDATVSGEVFVAAGGYVGRFARPTDTFLTWRDHATHQPWTTDELHQLISNPL